MPAQRCPVHGTFHVPPGEVGDHGCPWCPDVLDEIRRAIDAGVPIHAIRTRLDLRENNLWQDPLW